MGFNTYWTHRVADAEEFQFDGKPGYVKDIRVKIIDDPNWKVASNGNNVSEFFFFIILLMLVVLLFLSCRISSSF